jgi:flavin reductase (DIM6/NTAB) family NADH-FMN oxidoreductase RutF
MDREEYASGIRQAIRTLHYGLHVLTCGQAPDAHAATVTWVTQVSFNPRRIAVAVRKDSHIYEVLQERGAFALNITGEGQEDLASAFFKYVPVGDGEFAGYPIENGPKTGAPLFLDTPAWLECRVVEEANQDGDHGLFVADVVAGARRHEDIQPLSLAATGWSYGG